MSELRENPRKMLVAEVREIKNELPKNIRERIVAKFPEYDTKKGAALINNVLSLRTADARLTEILKAFHFEYKILEVGKTLSNEAV